jgi:hypothetical protein
VATPRKAAPARRAPAKKAAPRRAPARPAAVVLQAADAADLDVVIDETADDPALADVPLALSFTTPADPEAQERRDDPGTPFDLDGERYLAFRPKRSVRAMLFSAAAQGASDAERIRAVLTWMDACLSPLAAMRINARLLDRTDDLGIDHLVDLMNGLTAYWDKQEGSRADRRSLGGAGKRPPR